MPDYKGNIKQIYQLLRNNGVTKQSEADFTKDMTNNANARLKVYGQLKKWGTEGIGAGYNDFAKMISPNAGVSKSVTTKAPTAKATQQAVSVGAQAFGGFTGEGSVGGGVPKVNAEDYMSQWGYKPTQREQVVQPKQVENKRTAKQQVDLNPTNEPMIFRPKEDKYNMPTMAERLEADKKQTYPEYQSELVHKESPYKPMTRFEQNNVSSIEAHKTLAKDTDISKMISSAIEEGDKKANEIWKEYNDVHSGVFANPEGESLEPATEANKAKDPHTMVDEITKNLETNLKGYVDKHKAEIERGANKAQKSVDAYIQENIAPAIAEEVQQQMHDSQILKNMPKSNAEFVLKGVTNWVPGLVYKAMTMTPSQFAYEQEADEQYKNTKASGLARFGRTGVEFADPTFGATFKVAGMGVKKGAQELTKLMGTNVGREIATRTGLETLAKTGQYLSKFGGKAESMMVNLIGDNLAGKAVGAFAKKYVSNLPTEMASQALGMNAYSAMKSGISTYGQTGSVLEGGKAGAEALFSPSGAISGASFAVVMPWLHAGWGLSGAGWKAGDGIIKKLGWGVGKGLYDSASIVATGALMQTTNNIGKWLGGEKTDWTLNGLMEETAVAAAMKYNPNMILQVASAIRRTPEGKWDTSGMYGSQGASPVPFHFNEDERKEIVEATGKDNIKDALLSLFPDGEVSKGNASEDVVNKAQTNFLNVMNNLSWDTQNKLAMGLTGSMTLKRPRTASYQFEGNTIIELDKSGKVLSKKTFKTEDEKEAYRTAKQLQMLDADLHDIFYEANRKDADTTQNIITSTCAQHNVTEADIQKTLNKEPIRRTEKDWDVITTMMSELHDIAYPKGEVHVEQSKNEGANAVIQAGVTSEQPNEEPLRKIEQETDEAEAKFNEALKNPDNDWVPYYNDYIKGDKTPEEAYELLADEQGDYNTNPKQKEKLAPLAEYIDARSKKEGVAEEGQNQIDTKVSERVNTLTSGEITIARKPREEGKIITLYDADGMPHYVLSGSINIDDKTGKLSNDSPIVILGEDGKPHSVNKLDGWKKGADIDADIFANTYRDQLNQVVKDIIDPQGKLNPANQGATDAQLQGVELQDGTPVAPKLEYSITERTQQEKSGRAQTREPKEPKEKKPAVRDVVTHIDSRDGTWKNVRTWYDEDGNIVKTEVIDRGGKKKDPTGLLDNPEYIVFGQKPKEDEQTVIPMDKDGEPDYMHESVSVEDAVKDIYNPDRGTTRKDSDDYVNDMIDDAQKEVNKVSKPISRKKGEGMNAYGKRIAEQKAQIAEAQKKLDKWNAIKAEADKTAIKEKTAEEIAKEDEIVPSDYSGMEDHPSVIIARNMPRILPEDWDRETGLGKGATEKKIPGMVASREKGGVTIDEAVLQMRELLGDKDTGVLPAGLDEQDIRNVIIDIISNGGSRSFLKRVREQIEADKKAEVEYYEGKRDEYFMNKYGMDYKEWMEQEEARKQLMQIQAMYAPSQEEMDKANAELAERQEKASETEKLMAEQKKVAEEELKKGRKLATMTLDEMNDATQEESAELLRSLSDMSDEELLSAMRTQGADETKVPFMEVYDEYDARHNSEYVDSFDTVTKSLEDDKVSVDDAKETLKDAEEEYDKEGYANDSRNVLKGQIDALKEYIEKNNTAKPKEEMDKANAELVERQEKASETEKLMAEQKAQAEKMKAEAEKKRLEAELKEKNMQNIIKPLIDNGNIFCIRYTEGGKRSYQSESYKDSTTTTVTKEEYDWALAHGGQKVTDAEQKDIDDENEMNQLNKWFINQFPYRELEDVIEATEKAIKEQPDSPLNKNRQEQLDKLNRFKELWDNKRERLNRITSDGEAYKEKKTEPKSEEGQYKKGDHVMYRNVELEVDSVNKDGSLNLSGEVNYIGMNFMNISPDKVRKPATTKSVEFYKAEFAKKFEEDNLSLKVAKLVLDEVDRKIDRWQNAHQDKTKVSVEEGEAIARLIGQHDALTEYIDKGGAKPKEEKSVEEKEVKESPYKKRIENIKEIKREDILDAVGDEDMADTVEDAIEKVKNGEELTDIEDLYLRGYLDHMMRKGAEKAKELVQPKRPSKEPVEVEPHKARNTRKNHDDASVKIDGKKYGLTTADSDSLSLLLLDNDADVQKLWDKIRNREYIVSPELAGIVHTMADKKVNGVEYLKGRDYKEYMEKHSAPAEQKQTKYEIKLGSKFDNGEGLTAYVDLKKGDLIRLQWTNQQKNEPTAKGTKLLSRADIEKWLTANRMKAVSEKPKSAEQAFEVGEEVIYKGKTWKVNNLTDDGRVVIHGGNSGVKTVDASELTKKPTIQEQKAKAKKEADDAKNTFFDTLKANWGTALGASEKTNGSVKMGALWGGVSNKTTTKEMLQAQTAIIKAGAQYALKLAEQGYVETKDWVRKLGEEIKEQVQSLTKWDDEQWDEFVGELRKFKFRKEANGERKSLDEWIEDEKKNTNNLKEKENEVQLRNGTSEEGAGRHERNEDSVVGGSERNEDESTDGTGMAGRDRTHSGTDTTGGEGVHGLPGSEQGSERVVRNERNYHATVDGDGVNPNDYSKKSPQARLKANLEAVALLQQLEAEGREATKEEQQVLAKFSGWGGVVVPAHKEEITKVIGEAAYKQVALSANSSYYTPSHIIKALWDIAEKLGFKGGKILEGSAGIGNILSLIPDKLNGRSAIHAVELDKTTGGLLKALYPDAKVDVAGFQDTKVENNSVDLAITNVPFVTGLHVKDKTGDSDLSKKFGNIHDFCIAKNVRKLKEGGIGIFITTSGTLDNSTELRKWLVNEGRADVIGAFRLNSDTFGATGVTSDIIVVRKRVNNEKSPNAIDISKVVGTRTAEYAETNKDGDRKFKQKTITINQYFAEHPENMGGEMKIGSEVGDTFRPSSQRLVDDGTQNEKLAKWLEGVKEEKASESIEKTEADKIAEANEKLGEGVKEGSMLVNSKGQLCTARRGVAVPLEGKSLDQKIGGKYTKKECFEDYTGIKKALQDVLDYEKNNDTDEGLKPLLKKLNDAYDNFKNKYGFITGSRKISFLKNDVDFSNVMGLEKVEDVLGSDNKMYKNIKKGDIFSKRVIVKDVEPQPKNEKEGVITSIYKYGKVDTNYIAEKLGKSEEEVRKAIIEKGLGFENPINNDVEASFVYLSGNVREKLKTAEANNADGKYNNNIEALKKVLPKEIPAHLIDFNIGSNWINPKLYKEYIKERTGRNVGLTYVNGTWSMNSGAHDGEENRAFGVHSAQFGWDVFGTELIQAAMKNTSIEVYEYQGPKDHKEKVVDKDATRECMAKVGEIREDFRQWAKAKMLKDKELAKEIEEVYNDKYNNFVPKRIPDEFIPEYFGGASHRIKLRPHQAKAVIRATMEPVMLAHEVGTGKTFTQITTAMEMRRLGTAKKPMIVVQNATVGQFVASAKTLYPGAKILSIEDKDRTAAGRKDFYAKIKYNDWDMIIIPKSVLKFIPDSYERQMQYISDKIYEKLEVLDSMEDDPNVSPWIKSAAQKEISDLEGEIADLSAKKKERDDKNEAKIRENTKVKAEEMLDRDVDDVEDFDDMGIDALIIDEAHDYKHLGFATAIQKVKGVDQSYSKQSQGVYLKCQSVLEKTGGKNVVFATGTPVSNTAAEVWTFLRYLMPKTTLEEYGMEHFDDFVRNFGNVAQMAEFATSGAFKEVTRFAGYVNMPELARIWSQVADTVLSKDQPQVQKALPETVEGEKKATQVTLPQSKILRGVMASVRSELERFENMKGKDKKENSHIPLVMYGIAKAAAIDPRLVLDDKTLDDPHSKTNAAVKNILADLEGSKKYNGATALFCDTYQNKRSGFNIYEEIKRKLVEAGVPENQIAIISGQSDKKKLEIFDKVNKGEIRVVMGSTQTLGVGVNIQERLVSIHNLDVPNRPMDYTQRLGRLLRQGNLHKEWGIPVKIWNYAVEDSLDITGYQRLKTKGDIADSIMNGNELMANNQENRTIEEEEDEFGDVVANLSGSQFAILKQKAERDLRKYEGKQRQWEADQIYVHDTIRQLEGQIKAYNEKKAEEENKLNALEAKVTDGKVKKITIGQKEFDGISSMDEFFKEFNKKQNATLEELRKQAEAGFEKEAESKLTVNFDGIDFEITSKYEGYMSWATRTATTKRSVKYTCKELGLANIPVSGGYLKNAITEIMDNVLSGNDNREFIERLDNNLDRMAKDLEVVKRREGKPFEYEDELKRAQRQVEDYTEAMKQEMAEKEKKYAEMDKEADAVSLDELNSHIDDDEEECETRLSEDLNFPYGFPVRDKFDHYSVRIGDNVDHKGFEGIQLEKEEFAKALHSIDSNHKKDKNFSLNTAYTDKNGYLYIRKGNHIKFVGRFDLNDKLIVEQDLEELISYGTIRDREVLGDFIRNHSNTEGMVDKHIDTNEGGRKGNVPTDSVDIRQSTNVRANDKRVVPGISKSEEQEGETRFRILDENEPDDAKLIEWLDNQEIYGKKEGKPVYHSMQLIEIDGKKYLFPPMAAKQHGKLVQGIPVKEDGTIEPRWEQADENPDLAYMKQAGDKGKKVPADAEITKGEDGKYYWDGKPLRMNDETGEPMWYFDLKKGSKGENGKPLGDTPGVAYDPYQHGSTSPLNDQFKSAWNRGHLVTVEVAIPKSEIENPHRSEKASLTTGEHEWPGGVVAKELKPEDERKVILSRWDKPLRIVPDSEVAEKIKGVMDRNGIEKMPFNVVSPSLRDALIEKGVKIGHNEGLSAQSSKPADEAYEKWREENNYPRYKEDFDEGWTDINEFKNEQKTRSAVQKHVDELSKTLNTEFHQHTDASTITNKKVKKAIESGRNVKGWWDKDGVHLYMPNIHSKYEAERTIVHETVAHKGLRDFMGRKGYVKYQRMLWEDKTNPFYQELHDFVNSYMRTRGWDISEAVDEWVARKAEAEVRPQDMNMWQKIKRAFVNGLREIGYRWNPNIKDVRYCLWLSRRGLKKGEADALFRARRADMEYRLEHADWSPEVKDGEYADQWEKALDRAEREDELRRFSEPLDEDNATPMGKAVRDEYDRRLRTKAFKYREAFHDAMESLRVLQEAISGKKIYDINDAENAYVAENHMSSIAEAQWNKYKVQKFQPLEDAINKCVGLLGGKAKDGLNNLERYIYKKHGLERNRDMFMNNFFSNYALSEANREAEANYRHMQEEGLSPDDMADTETNINTVDSMRSKYQNEKDKLYDSLQKGEIDFATYIAGVDDVIKEITSHHEFYSNKTLSEIEKNNKKLEKYYAKVGELNEKDTLTEKQEEALTEAEDKINELLESNEELRQNDRWHNYDPNKNDYSGISEFDEKRKFENGKVEYNESQILSDVAEMEGNLGKANVDNVWKAIKDATDYAVDYSYESGQADSMTRDNIKSMYHWYVPLRGFADDKMEDIYDRYENDKGNGVGKVLKKAWGRTSLADSPLATISAMASKAINNGERNKMLQKFYRMVAKNPNDAVKLSEVWEVAVPDGKNDMGEDKVKWETALPEIPKDATSEEIADIVDNFNSEMRSKEFTGEARKVIGRPKYPAGFLDKQNANQHAVRVYINGRMKMMYITGDPRAAQALRGEIVNEANKGLRFAPQALNKWMASVSTSFSPEFILSNTSRDTLFANANIASKENGAYYKKFLENQILATQLVGTGIGGDKLNGESLFEKYYRGHINRDVAVERDFEDFMDNGGRTGFVAQQQLETAKKELKASIKGNTNTEKAVDAICAVGRGIKDSVEEMNMRAELINRFATYRTSRQMGRSLLRSVADAKEVSVNFNRHGAGNATEGNMGAWAGFFRNNYMFFNAGMQSMELLYRNVSKDKSTAIKTVAFMGMIPAMAGMAFAMVMANQDDEKYSNIPSWDRRNNICIPIDDKKYIKVPLPIELRAFWGMGDIFASIKNKRLQTQDSIGWDLVGQITQALPIDVLEGVANGSGLFPTAIQPLVQLLINESWTGKPIQKEARYNRDAPQWTRAYSSTSPTLVEICKFLHDKTREGVNTAQETDATGWLDISPAMTEHILKSYLGGPFTFVGKTFNPLMAKVFGNEDYKFSWSNAPMVSRLIGGFTDREADQTTNAKYFAYKREADNVEKEYANKANKANPSAKTELDNSSRGKRYENFKKANKLIEVWQKQKDATNDKMQKEILSDKIAEQKRIIVDALDAIE